MNRATTSLTRTDGAVQGFEEPGQPLGDIERLLLRSLQDVVIGLALLLDLRRQAVEALGAAIRTGQEQVAHSARDAAVAVVEWVQGDQPKVRKPSLDQRRLVRRAVGPADEAAGFRWKAIGRRRFEMHALAPRRAGDHLHRAGGIVTPAAHIDSDQARVAGGDECCVPPEQSIPGDRGLAVGGGVEHHFDHALDMTVHRGQGTDVDAESARDRGTHRLDVELFALDLAAMLA